MTGQQQKSINNTKYQRTAKQLIESQNDHLEFIFLRFKALWYKKVRYKELSTNIFKCFLCVPFFTFFAP